MKRLSANTWMLLVALIIGVVSIILVFAIKELNSQFRIMMSFVFIGLCFVPLLLQLMFRWRAPLYITTFYYLFIILSTLLGTIYGLYDRFGVYDIFLHTLSGVLLGGFGLYIFSLLYSAKESRESGLVIAVIVIVGFASICGVLWEVWEFFSDEILILNSQRHTAIDGTPLVGHEAVKDTMYDLICDITGGVSFAVGYIIYSIGKRKLDKRS